MMKYLAQIDIAPKGGFTGPGDKGLLANPGNGIDTFVRFISSAVGLMTLIAAIWFVFNFFIGAIGIISAGGDKAALENSRKKILTSITGLVIVVAAIFIVNLVGFLLGFQNILDIGSMFNLITGQK